MSDVFLSYASATRPLAARIAARVEALGYSVWWDSALLAHDSWGPTIERELDAARCVLVIWSEEAKASRWVRAEATRALDANKLVQVRLDDTMPPLPFDQIQAVGLGDWEGEDGHPGWQRVSASLAQLLEGKAPPRHLGMIAPPDRRTDQRVSMSGLARALPGWFLAMVALTLAVAGLPLLLAPLLLNELQRAILVTPLTSMVVAILMVGLLFALPRLGGRTLNALLALAVLGAVGAGAWHGYLAGRFIGMDPERHEPHVLGCGVAEDICTGALPALGFACSDPTSICPAPAGVDAERVLAEFAGDPVMLYGTDGIGRVQLWMRLAWNGLFLSIALFFAVVMSQALKPQIRRLMRESGWPG